jgi:general secretion pathway protein K
MVVALLVFAVCTALIVAMKSEFNRFYQRGANLFLGEQAYAYLRGAEALAGMALVADFDADKDSRQPKDTLRELWAQPTAPYALDDGGWLAGSLKDLQGRFNLNALSATASTGAGQRAGERSTEPAFTPAQEQFIRLLQALGEDSVSQREAISITRAVVDWLDSDSRPQPDGAEDDFYYGRTPAYRAANRPMSSVSELLAVANVTPQLYRALAPLVTVWPQTPAPLNVHTAPATVLRSINADKELEPLTESDGEALVDYREENGFTDIDDFLANQVFSGRAQQMTGIRGLLGERSSWFLLEAEVEVADRRMRLYSILERRKRRVEAVARAGGSL